MTSTRSSIEYRLTLVQEPTMGAAFEDNLLGRIGLAPPLILELQVIKDGKEEDASDVLPFLICQCSLLTEQGAIAGMLVQTASTTSSSGATLMLPTPPSAGATRGPRGRQSSGQRGNSASTVSGRSSGSVEASPSGTSDDAPAIPPTAQQPTEQGRPPFARMLYGTIVASPQQYESSQAQEKSYFFFPEISVRTPGKFKIQCTLMRLPL